MKIEINDFVKEVGINNVNHGFRNTDLKPTDFVALIHGEVSEILEEFRKGKSPTETYYKCKAPGGSSKEYLDTIEGCPIETDCCNNNCIGKYGKPEGVPSELADVIIRCFDMADYYGINLEKAIIEKMEFNVTRPYMHGKKF